MNMCRACYCLLIMSTLFYGCSETPESRYKILEQEELSSGIRYDTLFKGLYFGMKHQDFRDYCYYKNTVEHDFKNEGMNTSWLESNVSEMEYPAAINFYPVFKAGVITEMNASIYYKDAVFKDGTFDHDSLLLDVLGLMKNWYGGEFLKIKSPVPYKDDIYVNIHGNRRITVYPTLGTEVKIWMVDLYFKERGKEK